MSQLNDNIQAHENIHSKTISWIKKVAEENNQTNPKFNLTITTASNDNKTNNNHTNSLYLEKPNGSWDSYSNYSNATLSAENGDDEFKQQLKEKKSNNFDSEDFYKQKSYFDWDSDPEEDDDESTLLDDDEKDAEKPTIESFDDAIYYANEILKRF